MPLPEIIEIIPPAGPVRAEITVPGSKSITNRALVLAALGEGETVLRGALWSEDTQVMVECLQELGFMVNVAIDPEETCNRTITVYGLGGHVPRGGSETQPLELFVGNAGTAARFLAAMVCLGEGVYRLHGVPRMHERPQAALFSALRELGYRVDSENNKLPAVIHGAGPKPGAACRVSIGQSSQFASALLLSGKVGGWRMEIIGENAEESPYVAMTSELMKAFPKRGGQFQIEPDSSSGSYFVAAGWLFHEQGIPTVSVTGWPESRWQIDSNFIHALPLPPVITRSNPGTNNVLQLGDSIMTAVVLAPFAGKTCEFRELGRLRVQECERVVALRTELAKCGAKVVETGDTLIVEPSSLHGAEIDTYNDHRMAMCFAVVGLKVPGIRIRNPACVKKTFPNFFQKLAAPAPRGLGIEIRDGQTARRLAPEELFAD